MTNPDNVGGLPDGMVMVQRSDAMRLAMFVEPLLTGGAVQLSAMRIAELCRAAPAGGDARTVPFSDWMEAQHELGELRTMLARSAPAGSGEVEPLPVFSGNWIYVDTGQRFSGADLDGAAFAVYEPLLRKLQQGAESNG